MIYERCRIRGKCIVCKRDIVNRRKDAKYCDGCAKGMDLFQRKKCHLKYKIRNDTIKEVISILERLE